MLINKKTNSKPGRHDRIIYIALFILFIGGVLLAFVYSVKFIGKAMNSTFSATELGVVEEKYGQLQLDKYNLIAAKLDLKTSETKPEAQTSEPTNEATTTEEVTTEEVITEESTVEEPLMGTTTIESEAEPTVIIPEVSPRIVIINSTQVSGLAANLRTLLQADDFNVISVGSSRDNLARTVIKAKESYGDNSQYLADIKKIVSSQYDFETTILDSSTEHDIEIIIGAR